MEASKFPEELRPRARVRSEGSEVEDSPTKKPNPKTFSTGEKNKAVNKSATKDQGNEAKKKVTNGLSAPALIQNLQGSSSGGSSGSEVKIPPPPEEFRDPPRRRPNYAKPELIDGSGADMIGRAREIHKALEQRMEKRKSQYEVLLANQSHQMTNGHHHPPPDVIAEAVAVTTTASLPRTSDLIRRNNARNVAGAPPADSTEAADNMLEHLRESQFYNNAVSRTLPKLSRYVLLLRTRRSQDLHSSSTRSFVHLVQDQV